MPVVQSIAMINVDSSLVVQFSIRYSLTSDRLAAAAKNVSLFSSVSKWFAQAFFDILSRYFRFLIASYDVARSLPTLPRSSSRWQWQASVNTVESVRSQEIALCNMGSQSMVILGSHVRPLRTEAGTPQIGNRHDFAHDGKPCKTIG
jgi:hypothetical protein